MVVIFIIVFKIFYFILLHIIPKDSLKANSFLRQVHDMIKQNPSWEQQIEINMLRDSIAKASGSARVGDKRVIFSYLRYGKQ